MTFELKTYITVSREWQLRNGSIPAVLIPSDYSFHARCDFSFSCGLQMLGPFQVGKLISGHHQRVACVFITNHRAWIRFVEEFNEVRTFCVYGVLNTGSVWISLTEVSSGFHGSCRKNAMALPRLGYVRFIPSTFHFIIHQSSSGAMLYSAATDGAVK
jgi:hypothetical protein